MITFNEFLEGKKIDADITECANLMVEMEVNPYEYIHEALKEIDPVLAEGWWDGVKQFGKNMWNAAGQVAKGVWDGGGLKHGLQKAADTVAGPVAKFDSAERALKDLRDMLMKSPEFNNFQSSTGRGTVGQYVAAVLNALRKDKENIPQLNKAQVQQDYGTRGSVAAAGGASSAAAAPAAGAGGSPAAATA